ncbi:endonuclease NucS domain-containing protein [Fulvimarina sp. MAC3]|uniref:endonuclease NucS domain-containing protein n=1 Tax=Fulvimarina sp. MAC3 TaxID=3148887 RepID=UPI0031FC120F
MRDDYRAWLVDQGYAESTQTMQIARIERLERAYGSLDELFDTGTIEGLVQELGYTTADAQSNRPNPSRIVLNGDFRTGLQSLRDAAKRYIRFRLLASENASIRSDNAAEPDSEVAIQSRFSLERDMQFELRRNIASLESGLTIIDDGAERSVDSGFIDITCRDRGGCLVVVELKAGRGDSRAIGQILGYMGDLSAEEENAPVRGILVAHDFDRRSKAASRVVPQLELKRYSISFNFEVEA